MGAGGIKGGSFAALNVEALKSAIDTAQTDDRVDGESCILKQIGSENVAFWTAYEEALGDNATRHNIQRRIGELEILTYAEDASLEKATLAPKVDLQGDVASHVLIEGASVYGFNMLVPMKDRPGTQSVIFERDGGADQVLFHGDCDDETKKTP